jgi:hypothetical protein
MGIKAAVQMPKTDREFQKFCAETYDLHVLRGTGTPLNNVVADIGTLFLRIDGGANTTLYVKESGNGASTGWVAK